MITGSYRRQSLRHSAPGAERFDPICRPAETHVQIHAVAVVEDWLHPCHPLNPDPTKILNPYPIPGRCYESCRHIDRRSVSILMVNR